MWIQSKINQGKTVENQRPKKKLKAVRGRRNFSSKGANKTYTWLVKRNYGSQKIVNGMTSLKCDKKILYSIKISFKSEGVISTFPDEQKQKIQQHIHTKSKELQAMGKLFQRKIWNTVKNKKHQKH